MFNIKEQKILEKVAKQLGLVCIQREDCMSFNSPISNSLESIFTLVFEKKYEEKNEVEVIKVLVCIYLHFFYCRSLHKSGQLRQHLMTVNGNELNRVVSSLLLRSINNSQGINFMNGAFVGIYKLKVVNSTEHTSKDTPHK